MGLQGLKTSKARNGMEGVIEEGADALEKDEEGAFFDSGLTGAALRTEHYEITGYQATIAMAKILGLPKVVTVLTENLNEELAAAEKIAAVGGPILKQSADAPKKPKADVGEREIFC